VGNRIAVCCTFLSGYVYQKTSKPNAVGQSYCVLLHSVYVQLQVLQVAQLPERDRATLCVIEYFVKSLTSLKVIRNDIIE